MDTVNKTLLLSLKQEVVTLNNVVKSLPGLNCDGEVVRSWLFPTKPHYFVNELINSEEFVNLQNFKRYLELIIDRLYVGIRLVLNYIEGKTENQPKGNRFIHKPKLITLGFTFQRLWEVVSVTFCQNTSSWKIVTATEEDNFVGKMINKEIQTNIISLNKCDSCSSAILCMKNLLQSFQKNEIGSPSYERALLRPKIYDITQFGCMLQTTTAVEKGVNMLYEKLYMKEQERELLHTENQHLKEDITRKAEQNVSLKREVDILKKLCEKDALKMTVLSKQNEELFNVKRRHDLQIKTLNDIINNFEISIKVYKEKIVNLMREKERMNALCQRIMEKQLNIVKFGTCLQLKLFTIEDENLIIKNSYKRLEETTDNVIKRLEGMSTVLTALYCKTDNMSNLSIGDFSPLKSKLQEFKESLKVVQDSASDSKRIENPKSFPIKGNPIEDLSRQLEENNEAIRALENENVKLRSIVSRLSSLKK